MVRVVPPKLEATHEFEEKAGFALTPSTVVSTPRAHVASEACSPVPSPRGEWDEGRRIPFERYEEWLEQMRTPGAHRSAVMAYNFCSALELDEWQACRVVLVCLRMLSACHYELDDVEVALAMALHTMQTKCGALGARMGAQEKVLVAILHLYCAHSMVFDEFVPLRVWHEWLFAPFCNLRTMNMALQKVCVVCDYRFCVRAEELAPRLRELREGGGETAAQAA